MNLPSFLTRNGKSRLDAIDQKIFSESAQIFDIISESLRAATREILIVTPWFTDPDLLSILVEKAKSGVKVEVIIAEKPDNEIDTLSDLKNYGGLLIVSQNTGYGMMHKKYCVIDQEIAVHGSYNYTVNARRNNDESVIFTRHKETIQALLEDFENVKRKYSSDSVPYISTSYNGRVVLDKPAEGMKDHVPADHDFQSLLEKIINSGSPDFDRAKLIGEGFERSRSCNGEPGTLPNIFDSIYFNYRQDVRLSEEAKEALIFRIREQTSRTIKALTERSINKENQLKAEFLARDQSMKSSIKESENEIEKATVQKEIILKTEIRVLDEAIATKTSIITELKRTGISAFKKSHEMYPIRIMWLIVFCYLVVFYSSAGYILVFSHADLQEEIKLGFEPSSHSIFEPNALAYSWNRGITSLMIVLAFVIIPIGFSLADRFIKSRIVGILVSYLVGIVIIDILVALFVSRSIHEAKILLNETNGKWDLTDAFKDLTFYLVFIFGSGPLIIFKVLYNKMMDLYAERNPDNLKEKNRMEIREIEEQIKSHKQARTDAEQRIETLGLSIIGFRNGIEKNRLKLDSMKEEEPRLLHELKEDLIRQKGQVETTGEIYISKVNNHNTNIPVSGLRDRISAFLGGWTDFLHSFFSVRIASEQSAMAQKIYDSWFESLQLENQFK